MPPSLSFEDVLDSPEFTDTITVTVNQGVIGTGGEDVVTPNFPETVTAIVVPGKSNLRRGDDGSRVVAYIEVFTAYPLSAGYKTNDSTYRDADTICWHSRVFTVISVEDYSAFGPGFVKAGCDLLPLNPTS
jgi:hypothetical protein